MIYEISDKEYFVNFIDFNNIEDLGCNREGLTIECCSAFAFLTTTHAKPNRKTFINILLIDPYYAEPKIGLFRSIKSFESGEQDVILRNIVSYSGTEVKMLQQENGEIKQLIL